MRPRPILWVLVVISGLILAACSSPAGSPSSSDAGGGQSEAPAPSQADASSGGDGGGGGQFGGGSGSVQYEIRGGGVDDSGELPFAGNFAYFQRAGVTYLVFTDDTSASEANGVILILSDDGNVFEYLTNDLVIPAAECDWNIDHNDASGAAGSFTCNDASGFGTDGTIHTDLDISGSFNVDI